MGGEAAADRMSIFDADCEYGRSDPAGCRSGVARVGKAAGGRALAVKLYEPPPGDSVCPSHHVGVRPGNPEDQPMFRRSDGGVDYYEGET